MAKLDTYGKRFLIEVTVDALVYNIYWYGFISGMKAAVLVAFPKSRSLIQIKKYALGKNQILIPVPVMWKCNPDSIKKLNFIKGKDKSIVIFEILTNDQDDRVLLKSTSTEVLE